MKKQPEQINFDKRDAEKIASRKRDIDAIAKGASAKVLRKKNFMFSGIDMSKVVIILPNGERLYHPSMKKHD